MLQKASKVSHEKQNFYQQLEARPNTSTKTRLHNLLWEARLVFFKKKKIKNTTSILHQTIFTKLTLFVQL